MQYLITDMLETDCNNLVRVFVSTKFAEFQKIFFSNKIHQA